VATSRASPATWKPGAALAPPSPGGCAPFAGFYKYAVEEELLEHSPAAHVRRPRLDCESHATALHRNELGAMLVAAGLGPPAEHALISLLALNGQCGLAGLAETLCMPRRTSSSEFSWRL
jgi:hypothetical protein